MFACILFSLKFDMQRDFLQKKLLTSFLTRGRKCGYRKGKIFACMLLYASHNISQNVSVMGSIDLYQMHLHVRDAIPMVTHNITFSCREITTTKKHSEKHFTVTELFWDALVNCHLKFTATVS